MYSNVEDKTDLDLKLPINVEMTGKWTKTASSKCNQRNYNSDHFKELVEAELQQLKAANQMNQHEIQQLRQQNEEILKKLETSAGQIKSFKELGAEVRAFFSIHGYSKLLDTDSLFKKVLWSICILIFFGLCMLYVELNVRSFTSRDVVTQVKVVSNEILPFPAVTFCLTEYVFGDFFGEEVEIKSLDFSGVFHAASFERPTNYVSINDFEKFSMFTNAEINGSLDCFTFNGGRNASWQKQQILSSKQIGSGSGLDITLDLNGSDTLFYFVSDNGVRPIFNELENLIELSNGAGKFVNIGIRKTIDIKIPEPYSQCISSENINSQTSDLVTQILEQNITYRQATCYELCYNKYLSDHALANNLSTLDVYYTLTFDFKGNCSRACPLECRSTSFEVSQTESLNLNRGFIKMNFFYSSRKFTEISQAIKTTEADFISNTGGVLGLFLDLTFLTFYRIIFFLYDVTFV